MSKENKENDRWKKTVIAESDNVKVFLHYNSDKRDFFYDIRYKDGSGWTITSDMDHGI